MKTSVIFFTMLILGGSTLIVYAHPDPVSVTVQNQNGVILYTNELGTIVNDKSEPVKLFTVKWVYNNFIMILSSVIIAIMIPVSLVTYKEDIQSLIFK